MVTSRRWHRARWRSRRQCRCRRRRASAVAPTAPARRSRSGLSTTATRSPRSWTIPPPLRSFAIPLFGRWASPASSPVVTARPCTSAKTDDVVYAPDQPDFLFNQGLAVAAWINPDRLGGTQTLVRKRLDGTSSFLLALEGKQLLFILKLTSGRVVASRGAGAGGPVHPRYRDLRRRTGSALSRRRGGRARQGRRNDRPRAPARSSSATTPTVAASPARSTASGSIRWPRPPTLSRGSRAFAMLPLSRCRPP